MEIEIQSVNIPEVEVEITAPCVNVEVGVPMGSDAPIYDGATEVTPTDFAQTLNTANKAVKSNIIINPIPSNYGKIAYNGAHLIIT